MECAIEHPPPLRRYTLQLNHGGTIDTSSSYQNYKGGKAIFVRNLYMEASLDLFKRLAKRLGYKEGFQIYYRRSSDGVYIEITKDLPHETVSSQLSVARVLDVYLVNGVREQIQMEEHPSIMFWNSRGFNDKKVDQLRALNLIYQPNILFLSETGMTSTFSSSICYKLHFHDFRDSPAKKHMENLDNCVGLAMLWTNDVDLEFEDGSDNFLECMVKVTDSIRYMLIGFYGYPKDKSLSWKLLKKLSDASTEKRLVIGGDLNEILKPNEKTGVTPRSRMSSITNFGKALAACNLVDLPYEGSPFTWIGGSADKPVKERLDRVVARVSWKDLFTLRRVLHLTTTLSSDHIPILLQTDSEKHKIKIRDGKILSFIEKVKQAYISYMSMSLTTDEGLTTVSRMESIVGEKRDLYYDAVKLVAPHLIQLDDITVFRKNKVTRERLVTLKGVHNIEVLLLNSIDAPKRSREYDLPILPQFPYHVSYNLSKYLAETWSLIEFIPKDGNQESLEMIVDKIIEQQVTNLITWFDEVSTRDGEHIGSDRKSLPEILKEDASMIGRAVIVFDIIMYQLGKEGIRHEGAITELEEILCGACGYYFGEVTAEDSKEKIGKPLQYLLDTFQWRHSENRLQYRIPKSSKDNYEDLFAQVTIQMLEAERDVVLIEHPWVQCYIENGTDKEKLVKEVGRRTIADQLDVLKGIGCISYSKDDEIALCRDDKDCKLVIKWLQEAASEAIKTLSKNKKSMTYNVYFEKLREAYIKIASNKKREMVGDGEKQGEKKARN